MGVGSFLALEGDSALIRTIALSTRAVSGDSRHFGPRPAVLPILRLAAMRSDARRVVCVPSGQPLYPNRVSTFRVICSICGSRPASPWAQSVDPDVTTVAPALFVYAPSTAWP